MNFSWKETTPSSEARAEKPENLDSTSSTPSEANSRRRSTVEKMPTEAEIEEFFSAAEKKLHKEFAEKYVHALSLSKTDILSLSLQILSNQTAIRN